MGTWTLTRSISSRMGPNTLELLLEVLEYDDAGRCEYRLQRVFMTRYQANKLVQDLQETLEARQRTA